MTTETLAVLFAVIWLATLMFFVTSYQTRSRLIAELLKTISDMHEHDLAQRLTIGSYRRQLQAKDQTNIELRVALEQARIEQWQRPED